MMRHQQSIHRVVVMFLLGSCMVASRAVGQDRVSLIGSDFSAWRSPTGDWVTARDVSLNSDDERKLSWKDGTGAVSIRRSGCRPWFRARSPVRLTAA